MKDLNHRLGVYDHIALILSVYILGKIGAIVATSLLNSQEHSDTQVYVQMRAYLVPVVLSVLSVLVIISCFFLARVIIRYVHNTSSTHIPKILGRFIAHCSHVWVVYMLLFSSIFDISGVFESNSSVLTNFICLCIYYINFVICFEYFKRYHRFMSRDLFLNPFEEDSLPKPGDFKSDGGIESRKEDK